MARLREASATSADASITPLPSFTVSKRSRCTARKRSGRKRCPSPTLATTKKLDLVALATLPANNLVAGDVGTVVMVHGKDRGHEVEFMTFAGETLGVLSLAANQVRPFSGRQVLDAREFSTAR